MATPGSQWTDERCAILRERYPHENTAVLAKFLGKTLHATYGQARKMGLRKSAEYTTRSNTAASAAASAAVAAAAAAKAETTRATVHGFETMTPVRGGVVRRHVMR